MFFTNEVDVLALIGLALLVNICLAAGFSLLTERKFRLLMLLVVVVLSMALGYWLRIEIAGGFMILCNKLMFDVSDYYHIVVYCFDIPAQFEEQGSVQLAMCAIISLLSLLYSFCAGRQRLQFIPFAFSLAFLAFPIMLECQLPSMVIGMEIANLLAWLVMSVSVVYHNEEGRGYHLPMVSSGLLMAAMTIVCFVAAIVIPQESFKRPSYWSNVYSASNHAITEIQKQAHEIEIYMDTKGTIFDYFRENNIRFSEIFGDFQFVTKQPSTIGAGNMGHMDALGFTNQEVLQITAPVSDSYTYVKGYYGDQYVGIATDRVNAHWESVSLVQYQDAITRYNLESFVVQTQIAQHYDDDCYTKLYISDASPMYWSYYNMDQYLQKSKSKMQIRYTGISCIRQFTPLYMCESNGVKFERDEGVAVISDNATITYYELNQDQIGKLVKNGLLQNREPETLRYEAYARERYLNCNTTCRDQLVALMEEMSEDLDLSTAKGQYTLATRVQAYLAKNYTYTLSPGMLPVGEDFVDYFLNQSKTGYCVYFASSAVMMMRAAGVPARYVEGYVFDTKSQDAITATPLTRNQDYVTVSVKDSAAHAWMEIYLSNVGWVDIEVTPGINPTIEEPTTEEETTKETNTQEETASETETKEELTTETETKEELTTETETTAETASKSNQETSTAASGSSNAEETTDGGIDKPNFTFHPIVLKIIGILLLAMICIYFIGWLIRRHHERVRAQYHRIASREDGSQNALVVLNYEYFERIVKTVGMQRYEAEAYCDFANRVAEQCAMIDAEEALIITKAYEKTCFSEDEVSREMAVATNECLARIALRIYQSRNVVSAMIFRYIRNFVD